MNRRFEYMRAVSIALMGIAMLLACGGGMHAQQFQWVYGSPTCVEGGLHGVKQLIGGGYVAVGESFQQPGGGCGTSEAYVVVTNTTGAQVWANSYAIGINSRATDVLELPNGDLIVCGYATIGAECHAATSQDIFVLHLTAAGGLVNWATYGGSVSAEQAWKIIRATVGDGITTSAGDYVIAGWTTAPNATGARDGYLLRIDAGLTLLWDRQYGGVCGSDDYFYGLDEVPTWLPNWGDIVAAGGSTNFSLTNSNVFVVRVNGNNGSIGAPPQNASWTFVQPASNRSNEEARSVIVLRTGQYAGDIVTTGFTDGAPTPSTNEEVFMLELSPDPCIQVANLFFGEDGGLPDRGYDLVEDANPVATAGGVVVTGYTNLTGGFGRRDVFLQRVSTGPGMALAAACMDYGGDADDEGWSIGNATNNVAGFQTPGYIINGFTQSPSLIGGDPQQLYLIKANVLQSSFCNNIALTFPSARVQSATLCGPVTIESINQQCRPEISIHSWQSSYALCYVPLAHDGGSGGNDGASGVEAPATITFSAGKVTPFPNPLTSGDVLNLRFELKSASTARVAVSDVAGRVLYRTDIAAAKGATLVPVSTGGWAAGSYLVRVTLGGVSSSARVVVVDK